MAPRVIGVATLSFLGAAFVLLAFVPSAFANPGIAVACDPLSPGCLSVFFSPLQTKHIFYDVIWDAGVGAGATICVYTSVGATGTCLVPVTTNNGFTWTGTAESSTFVTPTPAGSHQVELIVTAPSGPAKGSVTINACETIAVSVCGNITASLTTQLFVPEFAVASVIPAVLGFGAVLFLRRRSFRHVSV